MNSCNRLPVPPRLRRPGLARGLTTTALVFAMSGCVDIGGGAVELSWSLRDFGGDSVSSCSDVNFDAMRICWKSLTDGETVDGAPCMESERAEFDCSEANGISGFTIEPGRTGFWLEPVCDSGSPPQPDSYQVPSVIVRTVQDGQVVTLDSLLVVVAPGDTECPPAGCTCVGP